MSSEVGGAVTEEDAQGRGPVPKLRFPEFRNAGDWVDTALGKALRPVSREAAKPSLSYTGLGLRSHGKGTFRKLEENPSKIAMDRLYIVHRNDLIVNITFAWEGAIAIANDGDHGAYVSHRFPTYAFREGVSSPDFFRYIIRDTAFVHRLGVISPGGAGRNRVLNKNDFLRLSTLLPSPAEQQKIADFLSSLDAVIASEGARLAALKAHKKGLMQALFPAPGQTTPRLRFPEFRDAGEWETKTIGSLLKIAPTYGANAPAVSYDSSLPTYLRISDISDDGRLISENRASVAVTPTAANSMEHNDIALARTGASVGKSYIHDGREPLVFAGFLIRLRVDDRVAVPHLVYQFLQTEGYWGWVSRTCARSGQPGINSTEYASLPITLPKAAAGLKEQQQIADCLTSIDELAAALCNAIEALKRYKSSLTQRLFPSPREPRA